MGEPGDTVTVDSPMHNTVQKQGKERLAGRAYASYACICEASTGEDPLVITRRLNQVRRSFYVYLPREWVDRHRLGKNSEVRIEQTVDGALVIFPSDTRTKDIISGELSLEVGAAQSSRIENLLTGAYIIGADSVLSLIHI